jgi:hypothetical protein
MPGLSSSVSSSWTHFLTKYGGSSSGSSARAKALNPGSFEMAAALVRMQYISNVLQYLVSPLAISRKKASL